MKHFKGWLIDCGMFILGLALCLPFAGWGAARVYSNIIFDREIGGHLKRAADANSIEIARQELEIALKAMERWNLTKGYTSILYTTPDEDIGFWYMNVKSCLTQIDELPKTAAQGEKDLVLLKLRQTMLDHGDKGHEQVTVPSGISIYPHNTGYALFATFASLVALFGVVLIVISLKDVV